MLSSVVLVSATHEHESATGTRGSPPSRTSLPPTSYPSWAHSAGFELPASSSLPHPADSHWLAVLLSLVRAGVFCFLSF